MALELAVTQGPRAGETLEFGPRCTVRIGRIVRGNNLPIKDTGISSKHLKIECESGKWVLRDLGSSNGTSVNDELVDPDVDVEIRDGDVVKLGEETSISVKIEECEGSRLRRNPRRGGWESLVENSEEVVANSRRGRSGRARVLEIKEEEEDGDLGSEDEVMEEKLVKQANTRRNRSSKKEESVVSGSFLGKIPENSDLEGGEVGIGDGADGNVVEQKPVRQASTKRGRSSKTSKKDESAVSCSVLGNIPENSDLEGGEMGVGAGGNAVEQRAVRQTSRRQTHGSKNEESVVSGTVLANMPGISDLDGGEEEVASRKTRASTRKGRKLPQKKPPLCVPIDISEESGDNIRVDARNTESTKTSNLGEQDRMETVGDKEGNEEDCRIVENSNEPKKDRGPAPKENEVMELDLEKMTLGEWFDFLKVNLPKQMVEATEEMIKDMRLRAQRVHEYMVQQKNEKAKLPLG